MIISSVTAARTVDYGRPTLSVLLLAWRSFQPESRNVHDARGVCVWGGGGGGSGGVGGGGGRIIDHNEAYEL